MSHKVPPDLLELALDVARQAGSMLMNRPSTFEITSKSVAIDFATQMDKASEKLIVEALLRARPDDGIVGEEGADRSTTSGITWVIDPVDGTVNYLYGLPGWNVSIAAKDASGSIVGVVHAPSIDATWTAIRGEGAFYNGKKIRCNDPVPLDLALIGTGFAYDVRKRVDQGRIVNHLLPRIRDLRRIGAAASDICFVAMGAFDGYFEADLMEWDLAAAALIAQEAGAKITVSERGIVVCAGPTLHARLAEAVEGL